MSDFIERCRAGMCRAVVWAGSTATPYLRAGTGRPVLVLHDRERPGIWLSLTEAAAGRFRLIVPEVPVAIPDFERWLGQFLDGLGLPSVRILADQSMAAAAIGFTILEPERVERMVVISPTGPAIPGSFAGGAHPILFLRDDRPVAELSATVLQFLSDGDPLEAAIEKAS